ncbi:MAG: MarR family transcriptional regulator [Anaerolineae bacterium]|nr:MarR family transcriptional regulator [Anaerolineae bacterium]
MGLDTAGEPLGRLLARTMKVHRGYVHASLERLGLYRGQAFILQVLWLEEGLPQAELAVRTWVQPATMTTALQRMEQSGLIVRRPDPEDQRVSRVFLTEAGRALESPVRESFEEIEKKTFEGFSHAEKALLRQFLESIINNLAQGI